MIFPTSVFGGLDLARRALTAQQLGVQVAGHNVANATTPGYSRERVELVTQPDRRGVNVASVTRMRDRFLDFALLTEQQALGRSQSNEGLLQRIQTVINDPPDVGLSAVLDQLFQGFQRLSATPTDQAARFEVKDAGERLALTFQGMRRKLDQIKTDATTEINQRVAEANKLIVQIADLNRQIVPLFSTASPNDLLDQRDLLVSKLAEIAGVAQTDRADGTVQLALSGTGVLLVDGIAGFSLTATLNSGTDTIDLSAGGSLPVLPRSGRLGALIEARNVATGAIKQTATDLDTLAATVALQVNRLHAGGTGLTEHAALTSATAVSSPAVALNAAGLAVTPVNGSFKVIVHDATGAVTATNTIAVTAAATTLEDIRASIDAMADLNATITAGKLTITAAGGRTFTFAGDTSDTLAAVGLNTFFTGSTASTLGVNAVVSADVTKIAAAVANAADLVAPGDGGNALALAQLRTKLVMTAGTQMFTDFYGAFVGRIGSLTQTAIEDVTRQRAAVQVVENLQQQVSGVSTDEEMINLSQSQTAYAAAARFATTMNTLIGTLLDAFRAM